MEQQTCLEFWIYERVLVILILEHSRHCSAFLITVTNWFGKLDGGIVCSCKLAAAVSTAPDLGARPRVT
jgi:hypothetical protein